MTITIISLSTLKNAKNRVVGNPTAKWTLAQDEVFLAGLVDCLNPRELPEPPPELRIEAANVLASLSYGSEKALSNLLRVGAHDAFLVAVSMLQPDDSLALRSALVRGLRTLAGSIADAAGPPQWGLRARTSQLHSDAKDVLDAFFQSEALDIYLPLLANQPTQISISIAQLLASAIRTSIHRTAVTHWLPPAERAREVRGRRGWEKPGLHSKTSAVSHGGWVAHYLIGMLKSRESKVQEAALSALSAMANDQPILSVTLAHPANERDGSSQSALSTIISLCKSRSPEVQLAACLCATHIIRASTSGHHHPPPTAHGDLMSAISVMHVVNRTIESSPVSASLRTKACFILQTLVMDDKALCQAAYERGSMAKLATLLKEITPLERPSEWDEDEPESVSRLREAVLTTIATLSLFDNDIRRDVTDNHKLLPIIHLSLSHRYVGVRYAACQCVRALSRAVAVVRTSIVDSGVGVGVFELLKRKEGQEEEDRNVLNAALSCVCNLVAEFSPLRAVFLEQGVIPRLTEFLRSEDSALKFNSLWAIKNLLDKSTSEMKREIMNQVHWTELAEMLHDPDSGIQEQALHVVRNICETEEDINMALEELGDGVLMRTLESAFQSTSSDVQRQSICLLAHLANGPPECQDTIVENNILTSALRTALFDHSVELRRPAVSCVLELARSSRLNAKKLREAEFDRTLRRMSDYSGGVSMSPGGRTAHHLGVEDDREVKDKAKVALHWLLTDDMSL